MFLCDIVCDVFFFKQKTAYEMRISDWSSDVCSSDLVMTNEASTLLDSDASNKAADADIALQELGADYAGMAYVTATVTVWDRDPAVAAEKLRLVEKVIQGRDFTVIPEGMNAIEAWLGSIPGHTYANVSQTPISTINPDHLIPLSAVWAGPRMEEHKSE